MWTVIKAKNVAVSKFTNTFWVFLHAIFFYAIYEAWVRQQNRGSLNGKTKTQES